MAVAAGAQLAVGAAAVLAELAEWEAVDARREGADPRCQEEDMAAAEAHLILYQEKRGENLIPPLLLKLVFTARNMPAQSGSGHVPRYFYGST